MLAPELVDKRTLGLLALLLSVVFAYFVGPPAWNQNSRLALTRALVEEGRVIIDDYHVTTGDKSLREGHFYSDKAPGVSLLSTLPYGLFVLERKLVGGELPDVRVEPLDPALSAADRRPAPLARQPGDALVYNPAHRFALWLCRMVVISIPTVLAGLLGFLLIRRRHGRSDALVFTLGWLLATPALAYACALYGHQLVAALLFAGFALAHPDMGLASSRKLALGIGSLLGWAVLSEYTAAPAVLALIVWLAWQRGRAWTLWVVAGGLPWALLLGAYHAWAFGHPLATGYDFVYLQEFAEGMAINYGVGRPDPAVLVQLLFGSYRGLFYLAPILLLALWGLGVAWFDRSLGRAELALAGAIIVYYLILNSGYYMWDGGAALGPRHVVPMLPFLCLGLIPASRRMPWATLALGLISCAHVVLVTAAGPEAPSWGNPVWSHGVPALFLEPTTGGATTIGRLLGLSGPLSLVPLVLAVLLLARELTREHREPPAVIDP